MARTVGKFGSSGEASVHAPSAIDPYTSSVESCTTVPRWAASLASSRTCTPITFEVIHSAVPAIDQSTCLAGEVHRGASTSASGGASQLSPQTNVTFPATGSRVARLPT